MNIDLQNEITLIMKNENMNNIQNKEEISILAKGIHYSLNLI